VSAVGWVGVLVFVVGVLVSVMLHEAGHFLTARRFGMKVTEFFVGFGPRLWSFRRGETEYGVKAIPAGGYVKIVGMTDLEPVDPEDQPRAFYRAKAWKRAVVLSAGSATHIVIGFVLLLVAFSVFGVWNSSTSTSVGTVTACVPVSATATACGSDDPAAPAEAAGVLKGDRITAVDGTATSTPEEVAELIRAHPGTPITLTVDRDGSTVQLTVTPAAVQRADLDDPSKVETVGAIGVSFGEVQRVGLLEGVGRAADGVWATVTASVGALVSLPGKIVDLVHTLFSDEQRDPNGLVGIVGAANISGQLAEDQIPASARIANLLVLLAGFNIFVGLFNMLPLLPLDGGHVAVLGWERLKAWRARSHGLPEPPRPDMNKLLPVAYGVFLVFVSLTVLLLAADIVKPVQL
jgi:membrane-associated protease RseP (regulator of RpoE activity)